MKIIDIIFDKRVLLLIILAFAFNVQNIYAQHQYQKYNVEWPWYDFIGDDPDLGDGYILFEIRNDVLQIEFYIEYYDYPQGRTVEKELHMDPKLPPMSLGYVDDYEQYYLEINQRGNLVLKCNTDEPDWDSYIDFNLRLDLGEPQEKIQLSDRNYVYTITPYEHVSKYNYSSEEIFGNRTVTYVDGLGRPEQVVDFGSTPQKEDMVTRIEYDNLGRQKYQFLPYVATGNKGAFDQGHKSAQKSFYSRKYGDNRAYSETSFDDSPLSRVETVTAPGNSWMGHPVQTERTGNRTQEVVKWTVGSNGELVADGRYRANQLFVTVTKDENWTKALADRGTVREYKDKDGRVVLKRTYCLNTSTSKTDSLSTYYVYDDFGFLRYVIPPKAKGDLGSLTEQTIDQLCYGYKYDHRKRMVYKKLPGADPVRMIYDKWNRLVLTQDGNQRFNSEWINILYDHLNRQVETRKVRNTEGYEKLRDDFMKSNDREKTLAGSYTILTKTYYDNYDFITSENQQLKYSTKNLPEGFSIRSSPWNAKGVITGYYSFVDGDKLQNIETAIYYDYKYRVIQTATENIMGGVERESTAYDFVGNPKYNVYEHDPNKGQKRYFVKTMKYDHAGRLKTVKVHEGNSLKNPKQLLVNNTYDELGQLEKKELHGGVQEIDYKYNIRGWLTHINDLEGGNGTKKLFRMELDYIKGMSSLKAQPQFNGNIAAMKWETYETQNAGKRAYGFTYDELNRLTAAYYGEGVGYSKRGKYDMDAGYDLNGNIERLYRVGDSESGVDIIDDLEYKYNGNQLRSVSDLGVHDWLGFADGTDKPEEYAYDYNGNMTSDDNKEIYVSYNHLNLPETVNLGDKGYIDYSYDGAGGKHQKYVYNYINDTQNMMTRVELDKEASRYYVGNYEYNAKGDLMKISHDEGYIDSQGKWHYFLKDHLGNVRVDFIANGNKAVNAQDYHYYPFGMDFTGLKTGSSSNSIKYNGKELQEDHGLDWYDYGARFYDPALGRWHSIDELAEHPNQIEKSPYAYAWNNPVFYNDPDGNCPVCFVIAAAILINTFGANDAVAPTGNQQRDHEGLEHSRKRRDQVYKEGLGLVGMGLGMALDEDNQTDRDVSKNGFESKKSNDTEDKTKESSRAARREAMRDEGIPTSQQPDSQEKNSSGREYRYGNKSVQEQTMDESHKDQPHWEAGDVKKDPRTGEVRKNQYGRPKLVNDKSKVNYPKKK